MQNVQIPLGSACFSNFNWMPWESLLILLKVIHIITSNCTMSLYHSSYRNACILNPDGIRPICIMPWNSPSDSKVITKLVSDCIPGPGEQGAAVILSAEEEKQKDALYKVNGFNAFASDKISLQRALKDIRHPKWASFALFFSMHQSFDIYPAVSSDARLRSIGTSCPLWVSSCHSTMSIGPPCCGQLRVFSSDHPRSSSMRSSWWTTSVQRVSLKFIRGWSLQNSQKQTVINTNSYLQYQIKGFQLLSLTEHCGKPLDDHVATHYDGKVKVIHQPKREGLIRTRLAGAKVAKGDVLIFLDSHCEANVNWLPPLLDPIAEDYRTVVCPFIDVIDYETFAYRAQDEGARGAFDWEFFYKRLPLLPEDLKHPADPFK